MSPDVEKFIKEHYAYDPTTGVVARRDAGIKGVFVSNGYLRLAFHLNAKQYKPFAHRVAWFLHFGVWPAKDIDHADGDPMNNRIANLRLATVQQNMRNTRVRANSRVGIKGVRKTPFGRFQARITVAHREIYLGTFRTAEEAGQAFKQAALHYHGEFIHRSLVDCNGGRTE